MSLLEAEGRGIRTTFSVSHESISQERGATSDEASGAVQETKATEAGCMLQ